MKKERFEVYCNKCQLLLYFDNSYLARISAERHYATHPHAGHICTVIDLMAEVTE